MTRGKAVRLASMCVAMGFYSVTANAANIFLESGGVVSAEAEHFSGRVTQASGTAHAWSIVPTETAMVGTIGTGTISGTAMQVLPDGNTGGAGTGPDYTPSIDYILRFTTVGTYRLYIKGAGFSGNSDSLYAELVEMRDGTGGTVPDWYAVNLNGSAAVDTWNASGQAEVVTVASSTTVTFPITTAGDYTLRIMQREDGALIDKVVMQTSTTAPTGAGPAESIIVTPEPSSAGILCLGGFAMLRMYRRRSR